MDPSLHVLRDRYPRLHHVQPPNRFLYFAERTAGHRQCRLSAANAPSARFGPSTSALPAAPPPLRSSREGASGHAQVVPVCPRIHRISCIARLKCSMDRSCSPATMHVQPLCRLTWTKSGRGPRRGRCAQGLPRFCHQNGRCLWRQTPARADRPCPFRPLALLLEPPFRDIRDRTPAAIQSYLMARGNLAVGRENAVDGNGASEHR